RDRLGGERVAVGPGGDGHLRHPEPDDRRRPAHSGSSLGSVRYSPTFSQPARSSLVARHRLSSSIADSRMLSPLSFFRPCRGGLWPAVSRLTVTEANSFSTTASRTRSASRRLSSGPSTGDLLTACSPSAFTTPGLIAGSTLIFLLESDTRFTFRGTSLYPIFNVRSSPWARAGYPRRSPPDRATVQA